MAKKKVIGEVEDFYIQGNCQTKSQEEIASILNVLPHEIEDLYNKYKKISNDKFQRYNGTTSMTESQSSKRTKKGQFIDEKNIHRL